MANNMMKRGIQIFWKLFQKIKENQYEVYLLRDFPEPCQDLEMSF